MPIHRLFETAKDVACSDVDQYTSTGPKLTPDSRSKRSCFLRLTGAAAVKMSVAYAEAKAGRLQLPQKHTMR